ncbi:hypothetical protein AB0I22_13420 [Streptomyces sp. NPDC050610]|uniref:hypothetical protein n=1 Tax=Streptomyces sp. NPDC050610 TaxID=3157097 RepID=UPI00342BC50B
MNTTQLDNESLHPTVVIDENDTRHRRPPPFTETVRRAHRAGPAAGRTEEGRA